MPFYIDAIASADIRETIQLKNRNGDTITTYGPEAVLTGECWSGEDQAALFEPAFTWNDPTLGLVDLAIEGADTADLSEGDYPILLTIEASGVQAKSRIATLRITMAPGAAEPPSVYCTYKDVKDEAGSLPTDLQDVTDLGDLADLRHLAREWTDATVLSRASRLWDAWEVGYRGIDQVWTDIFDDIWSDADAEANSAKEDFLEQFRGYLADDELLTTAADDRAIVRANAQYTLYLLYDRQIRGVDAGGYGEMAARWHTRAVRKLEATTFRIDVNGDGTTILRLPPG